MLFNNIKSEFPTLINSELAYFDSAASTQTHQKVLDRMNKYYEHERCNVHRGDFKLSQDVSKDCDDARHLVAGLLNTTDDNIMFTGGATEGLNMVAHWHKNYPVVIISEAEHTANILPWLAQGRTIENGRLVVLPVEESGYIDPDKANEVFRKYPYAFCSLVSTSNVIGITNNLKKIIYYAHEHGIKICLDACQTISSHEIDTSKIFPDFVVGSGHKMFGPTGIGFLYSRLGFDLYQPYRLGGGTVNTYNFNGNIEFYKGPIKHESGTPNIAGILGLGIAAEYIKFIGYENISQRLKIVEDYLSEAGLFEIPELKLSHRLDSKDCRNVFSFVTNNLHPSDISAFVGLDDVAVRVGKVCAHPIVNKISNGKGIFRVSTHIYNTKEDCDKLVESIWKSIKKLS
jgi:cysteine desulfurase / selenocysteine lyase